MVQNNYYYILIKSQQKGYQYNKDAEIRTKLSVPKARPCHRIECLHHVFIHTYIQTGMHACTYKRVHISMYKNKPTYVHTYIHTYI